MCNNESHFVEKYDIRDNKVIKDNQLIYYSQHLYYLSHLLCYNCLYLNPHRIS